MPPELALVVGIIAASLVGLLVYRAAIGESISHPLAWSLSAGGVSGFGAGLCTLYSSELIFGLYGLIVGREAATNAFTIPFAYVFLSFAVVALTFTTYRFGMRFVAREGASTQAR